MAPTVKTPEPDKGEEENLESLDSGPKIEHIGEGAGAVLVFKKARYKLAQYPGFIREDS